MNVSRNFLISKERIALTTYNLEKRFGDKYDTTILTTNIDCEIVKLGKQENYDLSILILNNIKFESGNFPPEERVKKKVLQLVSHLIELIGKPVIALYGWPREESFSDIVKGAGASFVFQLPCNLDELGDAVEKCLKSLI